MRLFEFHISKVWGSRLIALLLCLSLCSCGDTADSVRYGGTADGSRYNEQIGGTQFPDYRDSQTAALYGPSALPWMTWRSGIDAQGRTINVPEIASADQYHESRAYTQAISLYLKAQVRNLSATERLALAQRLASAYLAADQAQNSLRVLSEHFKRSQASAEHADFTSSLILAYAYGQTRNYEQSFAWFSKARRLLKENRSAQDYSERGMRLLLSSIDDAQLDDLQKKWSTDSFVGSFIGQERVRRLKLGPAYAAHNASQRFWEIGTQSSSSTAFNSGQLTSSTGAINIGVLLPLSGTFAGLGQAMRNGMELALDAAKSEGNLNPVNLIFEDAGSDAGQTVSASLKLIGSGNLALLLGPLISEASFAASDVARQHHIPILTFSKSSSFRTGSGVYRLGPTAQSQVESLLSECFDKLSFQNFAVVYPDDEAGREFALAFKQGATQRGGSILFDHPYYKGDSASLVSIAQQLESIPNLQAVFLPDQLSAATPFYSSFSESARNRIKLLGTASWDNPQELAHSRTAMSGSIFVSPFFSLSTRPIVTQFIKAYQQKYGRMPDFLAAQGFDAATMALAGVRRQLADNLAFNDAFEGIELYSGITGDISVGADGELSRRFRVLQLEGENLIELVRAEPEVLTNDFGLKG